MGQLNNIKSNKLAITLFLVFLLAIATVFGLKFYYLPQGTVAPGVSILGTNVSGLQREEALRAVNKVSRDILLKPVMLKFNNENLEVNLQDLKASIETGAAVEQAMKLGREGSLWQQFNFRQKIKKGYEVNPVVKYDKEKLEEKLKEVAKKTDLNPLDARLEITGTGQKKVIPEVMGRKIKIAETISEFDKVLLYPNNRTVKIVTQVMRPRLAGDEVRQLKMQEELSQFSTNFDQTNINRVHNIRVAANAINGHIIFPNEVFSFNQVVGTRTKENDYKESLIIVDSEFVPGTGGGVCQVSSTLYNVALLTNMDIVERRNHSRPVGYLPLGFDATVLDNKIDLKFKNTAEFPIAINTEVEGNTITIRFYGAEKIKEEIRLFVTDSEEIKPGLKEKEEPGIPKGKEIIEEGKPGFKLKVWRETLLDGKIINKEKISKDYYKVIDSIKYKGTGKEMSPYDILPVPLN